MEIRPLRPEDAVACDTIVAGLPYHFGNEEGRRRCADSVRSENGLVARDEGETVGFLTFVRRFEESAEITWMAVRSDRRRQGVGRRLIEELCAALVAEGRQVLVALTVSPTDPGEEPEDGYQATRAFYRSAGFILARDFSGYWAGDTPVLLVKPLTSPSE